MECSWTIRSFWTNHFSERIDTRTDQNHPIRAQCSVCAHQCIILLSVIKNIIIYSLYFKLDMDRSMNLTLDRNFIWINLRETRTEYRITVWPVRKKNIDTNERTIFWRFGSTRSMLRPVQHDSFVRERHTSSVDPITDYITNSSVTVVRIILGPFQCPPPKLEFRNFSNANRLCRLC